jgi:glycosyltransferase involved in cell wall biosynthesis
MSTHPISVSSQPGSPLSGIKICVLSTIPIRTSRIVSGQCYALVRSGASVALISPNPEESAHGNFRLRSFKCLRGALGKLISTPMIIVPALEERADIYHVHTFQLVPVAILLKLLFRRCVVYDMFEDFPSMVLTKEWLPDWCRRGVSRLVYAVEALACKNLDAVITADPAVLRQYLRRGLKKRSARRMVFYNFPTVDRFSHINGETATGCKRYDIVYSGGMSERTGVFVLLDAVEQIVQRGLRPKILMFGYTDRPDFKAEFLRRAAERKIDDCFELLGRMPHEQVPFLMSQARIGVVPLQPIPKFLKNIPTKVFEYWACALPIVASNLPPIRMFFREGLYGHLVDPTDPQQWANALFHLLDNPQKAQWMGKQARTAVRARFNAAPEQRKLLRLYSTLLQEH